MPRNKEVINKWADDLADYKQGIARLYTPYNEGGGGRYCCLGVAAKTMLSEKQACELFHNNYCNQAQPLLSPKVFDWLIEATGLNLYELNELAAIPYYRLSEPLKNSAKELGGALNKLLNFLQLIFGDNARVIAFRNGDVATEEYEYD